MKRGFVFGKFYPFHKGHEALIRFGLSHCDLVSVLVCVSDKELIPSHVRQAWIVETFRDQPNVDVLVFDYKEEDYPNTSVSSREVARVWVNVFERFFTDYQVVITSEPYGDYVAEYMSIQHLLFDMQRQKVPVSSSRIREDIRERWSFLPLVVRPYFVKKVVVLGTESTGKSTLVHDLAVYFQASEVTEAGRDLIPDSKEFQFSDLYVVANEHARRIREAEKGESPLVIVDTDIHITRSYARFCFNKELNVDESNMEANQADLYLYLRSDIPYVQDGTRLNEEQRDLLDLSHREELIRSGINCVEIHGNWSQRFDMAVRVIEEQCRLDDGLF